MLYFYKNDEDLILALMEINTKDAHGWLPADKDFGISFDNMLFYNGIPTYKYVNGKAVLRTEEEMQKPFTLCIS